MHLAQHHPSFKPELLALENRSVPSASVGIAGSKMLIQADNLGGLIQIRDDGKGNVTVTTPASAAPLAAGSNIKQIVVHGGAGNDAVEFRTTGNLLHALELDLDLGAGSDRAYVELYRGVSNVPVNIDFQGQAGNDVFETRFGPAINSRIDLHAALGHGSDSASVIMYNGLTGNSRASIDIAGESGADRVDLNLMGRIDAAAVLNARVENIADADDRVLVRFRGQLNGRLNLNVDKAAVRYGIQSRFELEAASMGRLKTVVNDGAKRYTSTLVVSDHAVGGRVTLLDRLDNTLTNPSGTQVTYAVSDA